MNTCTATKPPANNTEQSCFDTDRAEARARSLLVLLIGFGVMLSGCQAPESGDRTTRLYQQSCISCHGRGIAGAPRSHDKSAWSTRLEKGMPTLVANIQNGYKAMPPRGQCYDCNEEDYRKLIEFMAAPAAEDND